MYYIGLDLVPGAVEKDGVDVRVESQVSGRTLQAGDGAEERLQVVADDRVERGEFGPVAAVTLRSDRAQRALPLDAPRGPGTDLHAAFAGGRDRPFPALMRRSGPVRMAPPDEGCNDRRPGEVRGERRPRPAAIPWSATCSWRRRWSPPRSARARAAEGKSPGTKPKMVALLCAELIKAQEHRKKKEHQHPPALDVPPARRRLPDLQPQPARVRRPLAPRGQRATGQGPVHVPAVRSPRPPTSPGRATASRTRSAPPAAPKGGRALAGLRRS